MIKGEKKFPLQQHIGRNKHTNKQLQKSNSNKKMQHFIHKNIAIINVHKI